MVAANVAANKLDAIVAIETTWSLSLYRVTHKHNIGFERPVVYRNRGIVSRGVTESFWREIGLRHRSIECCVINLDSSLRSDICVLVTKPPPNVEKASI